MARCWFCKKEIDSVRYAYQAVTGWEHPRDQGGANTITLRETHEHYAHPSCIDLEKAKVKAGTAREQTSLLDLPV